MQRTLPPQTALKSNLLLVDDRPDNLMALEAVLEPLGRRMVTARSGPEALGRLLKDDVALILLDIQMPEMDGFETARHIKQREKTRSVPIIFITAHGSLPENCARAYATGAIDYITKPFDPHALQCKVRALLEMHDKAERAREDVEEQGRRFEVRQRSFVRDVLAGVTEGRLRLCDTRDDLPPRLAPCGDPVSLFVRSGLRRLRDQAQACAGKLGFEVSRSQDLVIAVGEAAMNAVRHGSLGEGRVYCDGLGTVQVWIEDSGPGIDLENLPRATMQRGFTTHAGSLGHGFWMILRTIDRMWLLTQASGTTVVLEQDRIPPLTEWEQG